jgi:hypothetical protein
VQHALAQEAVSDARGYQEVGASLLEQTGAQALLDVLPALVLEDHGGDPILMEEMGENETGGSCSDNSDLRAHGVEYNNTLAATIAAFEVNAPGSDRGTLFERDALGRCVSVRVARNAGAQGLGPQKS